MDQDTNSTPGTNTEASSATSQESKNLALLCWLGSTLLAFIPGKRGVELGHHLCTDADCRQRTHHYSGGIFSDYCCVAVSHCVLCDGRCGCL